MLEKYRTDTRYRCSQKAVLLTEGDFGNLCLITNISNGGLCLAVLGSSRVPTHGRIGVKVKGETFFCNIVNKGGEGLHCRFEKPVGQPDAPRNISPESLAIGP